MDAMEQILDFILSIFGQVWALYLGNWILTIALVFFIFKKVSDILAHL